MIMPAGGGDCGRLRWTALHQSIVSTRARHEGGVCNSKKLTKPVSNSCSVG